MLKRLALDEASDEAAGKGVAGAVGVVDLGRVDGVDGVLAHVVVALHRDDGRVGALGDDGDALALPVDLGQVGEALGNLPDVLCLVPAVGLGVGGGLGLVADDDVPVGRARVERLLEELADEGGREGEDELLVVLGCLFG